MSRYYSRLFAQSRPARRSTSPPYRHPVQAAQARGIFPSRFHVGRTTIIKWGHGFGLRIPLALARKVGLEAGTQVDIQRQGRRIILEPKPAVPTLDRLLDGVRPGRVPGEAEWRRRPGDPDLSRPS